MLENRAWSGCELFGFAVTFCEEGVDWNNARDWAKKGRDESPSVRKVWIEIQSYSAQDWLMCLSPSVRKVWIEIWFCILLLLLPMVTFCEEGVDWNGSVMSLLARAASHLLWGRCGLKCMWEYARENLIVSPSVRKVWIEIWLILVPLTALKVTFCEEGVDWNVTYTAVGNATGTSPSVRKVWIEMPLCGVWVRQSRSPSVRKVWIEM